MVVVCCGARDSLLSRAQVQEVQAASVHLSLVLDLVWVQTRGDRDRSLSLRTLGKSDFFTRELDELLLSGQIRLAVHSAKDLPDPLPKGLVIAALTKGQDPRDSLVFLQALPAAPCVASSSERREECVRLLYPQASFVDVRGTIHERLRFLEEHRADGVVIAEAALIRLNLTHLPRVFLPGEVALGQGRLALVVREGDLQLCEMLKELDYDSLSGT
jgi:hydroxymethylbilane synthase